MPDPLASDGRRTRWDAHRTERRRQLVEAALEVLGESGPEFGLDQVADRAGVTKPVIYRHFADRSALVDAMGERATEILLDDWLLPALGHDTTPLVRIRVSIDRYLGFVEANPQVYWLYVRHAPADGSDVARASKELLAAAISGVLGEFLRVGGIPPEAAEVWGHGLVGFVQNAAEWWLVRRTMSRGALADHLSDLVWAQCEGLARRHGLVLDPDERVTPGDLGRRADAARARPGDATG